MKVLSWNVDVNEPYVYDLSADHLYEPYDRTKNYPDLYVDVHSLGTNCFERLGLEETIYRTRTFCNLDEFYFFRTILQWESIRPTVVLQDPENYRRVMTYSDFLSVFAERYKIIYGRWIAYDPSRVSMAVMFKADNEKYTFREWMSRCI